MSRRKDEGKLVTKPVTKLEAELEVELVVSKMGKFNFNKHHVCLNPESFEVFRSGKDYGIVHLAQSPDGDWLEGYDYHCYNGGGGGLPSYGQYRKKHQTREQAIMVVLNHFLKCASRYEKYKDNEGVANRKFKAAILRYMDENGLTVKTDNYEPKVGVHGQLKLFFA